MSDLETAEGTIKFYNQEKGFGFLKRLDGKPDVFLHHSMIKKARIVAAEINEGDRFQFEVLPVKGKNPRAQNVRRI